MVLERCPALPSTVRARVQMALELETAEKAHLFMRSVLPPPTAGCI